MMFVFLESKASVTELPTVVDLGVWRSRSVSSVDPTLNSPLRRNMSLIKIIKHDFTV